MKKNIDFRIIKAISVISDTHFGAKHALFPDTFITKSGNKINSNRGQKLIYNFWKYYLKKCNEFNVDTVIHCGDVVHGVNPKSKTTIFHKLDDEIDLAVSVLKELTDNRNFIMVAGTGFHESLEFELGQSVCDRLNGEFAGWVAEIKIQSCDKTLNVAHSLGSPSVYTPQIMDREVVFYKLAEAKGFLNKADWLIRGHLHLYFHQDSAKIHSLLVPCWCGYEPIKDTKLLGKRQPDIGGIILLVDTEGRILPLHFLMEKNPTFYFSQYKLFTKNK